MQGNEVAIYMLPSSIAALLHFDNPVVVELKVILKDLQPFVLEK